MKVAETRAGSERAHNGGTLLQLIIANLFPLGNISVKALSAIPRWSLLPIMTHLK